MSVEWVEVYRSPRSPGLGDGIARLQDAGIPVRVSPARSWRFLPYGVSDPDVLHVPAERADEARGILAVWDAESEVEVERHLRGMPAELAVAVCVVTLVVGLSALVPGQVVLPIICGVLFLLCLPTAWKRIRRTRTGGSSPTKTDRWF